MLKLRNLLLAAALSLFFANVYLAAEQATTGQETGSAVQGLISLSPDAAPLADIAVPAVKPAPAPVQPEEQRAIKPGRDLTPKVEDAVRVKAVLKLVSDIYNGVHLPYPQDGSTFKNKEGKLPVKPVGYYKEYTLLTGDAPHVVVIGGKTYQVAPDLSARGSERVIIGGGEFLYYTPDHYKNFILLTVVQ